MYIALVYPPNDFPQVVRLGEEIHTIGPGFHSQEEAAKQLAMEFADINFDGDQDGLEILSVLFGISGGVGSLLEPEGTTYQRDTNLPFQTIGGQGAAVPLVRPDVQNLFLPSRGQANRHVLVDEVQYAVIFRLRATVVDPAQAVPTALNIPDVSFDFWTHISTPIFF